MAPNLHFERLANDTFFDEVCLVDRGGVGMLRLRTFYRYKTSGLSGNEWRTSMMWQSKIAAVMPHDRAVARDADGWQSYDGPYHTITDGLAAAYPGIYTSHKAAHALPVEWIEFRRKGRMLYRSNMAGSAAPLLTVAGHLPWAWIESGDHPHGTDEMWAWSNTLCFQPGCAEVAVSTYTWRKPLLATSFARRFCAVHLRRGDQAVGDSDKDYTVLDGPGPEGAAGWERHVAPAKLKFVSPR